MTLMLVLGLLLLVAVGLTVRWRHWPLEPPAAWRPVAGRPSVLGLLQLYLWYLIVALLTGLAAGVLVVGAGGRLAMRLLAATSPQASGMVTEADQVIGRISFEGTLGFIVFAGLPGGLVAAVAYALLHRALPRGLLGGLALGSALLLVLGVRLEPLRPENLDFRIVGPGWLSVAVYSLLALATGAFTAAAAGRLSRLLPLPRWSALGYLPLLVVLTMASTGSPWTAAALLVGGAAVFVVAGRLVAGSPGRRRGLDWLLRSALVVAVVLAAPGWVRALSAIIG